MIWVCKHPTMGKWYLANRFTRVWRRDCLTCGYYETYKA